MSHEFSALLEEHLPGARCRRVTLSRPSHADARRTRVQARPIELKGETAYQLAYREGNQERHENLSTRGAIDRLAALFDAEFLDARLFLDDADIQIERREGRVKIRRAAASLQNKPAADASTAHNRSKQYLIPDGVPCPFLIEIGIMTPAGKVKADRQHKFRQINRFLEFVEDILPELPADGPLHIVDFGCGKSSLTFAVHHLLTAIHQRDVRMMGLDRNPSVVATCAGAAERLACRGLSFQVGDIADFRPDGPVDLAISLHACDTATDHALAQAVAWRAKVILAAPCCQHELAPQLDSADLAPLLRHGILRERFAALTTDALRAACLESAGYRTQVIEFIDLDHTPKNLLLRAVRRQRPAPRHDESSDKPGAPQATPTSDERATTSSSRESPDAARLMQSLGITDFTLAKLLRETSPPS